MNCPTCGYDFDPISSLECPRCGDSLDCSAVSCEECALCSGSFDGFRRFLRTGTPDEES